MKLVFLGTPALAVPFMDLAAETESIAAVVSQPDQPAGRGLKTAATPVKARALERGWTVLQPERPSMIAAEVAAIGADLGLVVAYGRLLKKDILSAFRLGCVNVHFSLLPNYRGAAPIAWALARGERETGVTTFWIDEGMDTGPMLRQERLPIAPEDDAISLKAKLIELGLKVCRESLDELRAGRVPRVPQTGEPSLAPILKKEDGRVDFAMRASDLHNRVRGMREWPRARVELGPGRSLQILRTAVEAKPSNETPGTILAADKTRGALIKCAENAVWLAEVQPEGRKPMPGFDFLNGLRLKTGDRL